LRYAQHWIPASAGMTDRKRPRFTEKRGLFLLSFSSVTIRLMLRRFILSFALAVLFALGQQGAAMHEISHYADLAPSSQQDKAPHSPVCDQCLSYGKVVSALGVAYFAPLVLTTGFEPQFYRLNQHHSPSLAAYAARAPPQLA